MEPKGCLVGFLANLFNRSGGASPVASVPRVIVNRKFVSSAEADFFRVLRVVVGARGHVLAQVSLRQLLYFPGKQQGIQGWRNKVAAKTVDFVVCDPSTLKPLVAIELDEPSHAKPERQARDEEVRTILAAAGLPMVGVLTSRTYDTRELDMALSPYLMQMSRPRPD